MSSVYSSTSICFPLLPVVAPFGYVLLGFRCWSCSSCSPGAPRARPSRRRRRAAGRARCSTATRWGSGTASSAAWGGAGARGGPLRRPRCMLPRPRQLRPKKRESWDLNRKPRLQAQKPRCCMGRAITTSPIKLMQLTTTFCAYLRAYHLLSLS